MDNDCYHAVVTDPPYASGGLTTAERKASPARKYLSSSRYLSFDNDTRDQSTHFLWSVMWMQEAIRITRHGGWLMVFFRLEAASFDLGRLAGGRVDMARRRHLGQDGGLPPTPGHVPQPIGVYPHCHARQHRQGAGPPARVSGWRFPALSQAFRQDAPHRQACSAHAPPDDGSSSRFPRPRPFHGEAGRLLLPPATWDTSLTASTFPRIMFALPRTSWAFLFPDRGQPAESSPGFRETRADHWRECLTWDK